MTLSRSIHVAANDIISFFLMAEQYSIAQHMELYSMLHANLDGSWV